MVICSSAGISHYAEAFQIPYSLCAPDVVALTDERLDFSFDTVSSLLEKTVVLPKRRNPWQSYLSARAR